MPSPAEAPRGAAFEAVAALVARARAAQAVADAAPPPNGVDLGGDGLAVQCRPADYDLAGTDYQRTAAYLDSPGGIFIRRT